MHIHTGERGQGIPLVWPLEAIVLWPLSTPGDAPTREEKVVHTINTLTQSGAYFNMGTLHRWAPVLKRQGNTAILTYNLLTLGAYTRASSEQLPLITRVDTMKTHA